MINAGARPENLGLVCLVGACNYLRLFLVPYLLQTSQLNSVMNNDYAHLYTI
jgi:hypothetical protein